MNKKKLNFGSYTFCVFTTIEKKIRTIYQEFIGIVFSSTAFELIDFGFIHFTKVWKNHKSTLRCFNKRKKLAMKFVTEQKELNKLQKLRFRHSKEKILSVADLQSRSFT